LEVTQFFSIFATDKKYEVVSERSGYSSNKNRKPRRLLLPMAGHIKRLGA